MAEEEKKDIKREEKKEPVAAKEAPGKPARGPGRGHGRGPGRGFGRPRAADEPDNYVERVVRINRVSKVVKGGKNFSFNALVVAGDSDGSVGIGLGKSNELTEAIKKGVAQAKKGFFKVNLTEGTIPHEVIGRFKATRVLLKPAGPGTGVIAGGAVRAMCDAAGIKNILTKCLGSRNSVNIIKATVNGFERLRLKRRG